MRPMLLALVASHLADASIIPRRSRHDVDPFCPKPLETRPIIQFPNGTWAENIAVRSNGNILVTLLNEPAIYEVDPRQKPVASKLVHKFDGVSSLFGIAEVSDDVFAVAMGNFSLREKPKSGSYAVWKVDLNRAEASVSEVARIAEAELLNGITVLDRHSQTVLCADSALGVVFHINIRTGAYHIAIDDAAFKPPSTAFFPLGVNGVRYARPYLYFTNTFAQEFGRVPVDCANGKATGPVEALNGKVGYDLDDFARDRRGNAYISAGFTSDIVCVGKNGTAVSVAGGPSQKTILGPTSMVWGRTRADRSVLYVSTSGDKSSNTGLGGQVVALVMPR
ncbi:hypothetical protein JDV02_009551 [Purpureocillium takamizusanense]|uniref:Uncharacterized protein n=1 Tax=Purpureocillium takamizusanense TaxID=2060973 RepID=A0A9Q8VFS1_9HYPO|nr:uncharacterized protein JDV02_009551 [Purpureocillium takamizusanense]UNI23751.1 hypothetical protein JDV02_009551 [Purpureocillium takamizusanense]